MEQTFEVQMKLPSLNEVIAANRANRYAGAMLKADIEKDLMVFMLRLRPVTKPVTIDFEWQEANRRRDTDNIASAKKFILDAMVKKGILPDDSQRWVRGFTDTFTVGKTHKVKITIKEIEQ